MDISFVPKAEKELKALSLAVRKKVARIIDLMEEGLQQVPSKKLQGYEGLFRIHVGKDYVIIYTRDDEDILVCRIGHRGEVYKNLSALRAHAKRVSDKKK